MSKKRMIDTRFWSDNWVVDALNPHDRYLFLYLIQNERTTISGIYEAPLRTIANETGIDKEEVSRMLKRLEPKIYYRDGWVVIKNGIKHQNYKSPKIQAALQRELCNAPAELMELLALPQDLDMDLSCHINKTGYGIDTVAYTKPNLTKPNLTNKRAKARVIDPNDEKEVIRKLYYEVIKAYQLPVMNHNTLRAKINAMCQEDEPEKIIKYLEFMRDHYQTIELPFKPRISTALDIYAKRVQIREAMQDEVKSRSAPTTARFGSKK